MAEKAQQQTLSVRIGDGLRRRLERIRQQMVVKTGEEVSTSEIAKQLLESAREDRLELIELLADSTDALRQIRRKSETHQPLSRTEWTLLAHFTQLGMEALADKTPNRVSRASMTAVLDAFVAVYELRRDGPPIREPYYLGNLPIDCRPSSAKRPEREENATPDIVRRTAVETRARLDDPTWTQVPIFLGRNLYVLLQDEKLPGADALHRALAPYWPALWRLAARGHYLALKEPIREPARRDAARAEMPIPPVSDDVLSLMVTRIEDGDLSVLVSFPGPLGPMYPLTGYPKLSEFRAMLEALAPDGQRQWLGAHFFGYIAAQTDGREASVVWFRAPENGITVGLPLAQWDGLRALFRRAWEQPDVARIWDALMLEYGEL
jgi:hypothetical protein